MCRLTPVWTIYVVLSVTAFCYSIKSVEELIGSRISQQAYNSYHAGIEAMKTFQFVKADEYLGKAIEYNSFFFEPILARASLYEFQNKYTEAVSDLTRAIAIRPFRPSLYLKRADIHFKKGCFQESFQDYNMALELSPKYYKAFLGKASLYLTFADFENAEKNLKPALNINPGSTNAIGIQFTIQSVKKNVISLCQAGLKSLSDRKYHFAVEHFDKALKLTPNASILLLYRATAYDAINDGKAAIEDISRAIKSTEVHCIEKQPKLYELLNQRGVYYAKEKLTALAKKDFNSSIALNNHFAEPYNNRGVLFYFQGETGKACIDLAKACDLGMCTYYNRALENGFCKQ